MQLGDGAVEQSDKSGDSDEGTFPFFSCFLLGGAFSWISLIVTLQLAQDKGRELMGRDKRALTHTILSLVEGAANFSS